MKVHLRALGCRLNEAELEQWAQDFAAHGHDIAAPGESADLVVLNTCAVTQDAVRKSRNTLNRLHHDHPQAKLIVTGCYASLAPSDALQDLGIDLVVHNKNKDRLVAIARDELDIGNMPALATAPGDTTLFSRGRHRAFIKIQDGCRYRCTFCIVTLARGDERSRTIGEIIEQINTLVAEGINEAVLTGVHVGGYGSDIDSDLYTLIRSILEQTDLPRLRLASVEPWDLPENFFTLFENPRLMPHMHLPLQSGADSVLRRMARRCKTAEFERLATQARQHIPGFNITTDVIVGFPGETQEEWRQSYDFIERIGFGHLHIFTYSPREGTKAAGLPDPVSHEIKKARSKELHALGAQMKREALHTLVGQTHKVMWERPAEPDAQGWRVHYGYTPHYLRVKISTPAGIELENTIQSVRLTDIDENASNLIGEASV